MIEFQLFEILENIDDKKIENAYVVERKNIIPFLRIASLVACLVLIATVSLYVDDRENTINQEIVTKERGLKKEQTVSYDKNMAREECVGSLPRTETVEDNTSKNDIIVKQGEEELDIVDKAENTLKEETVEALEFYGGMYTNEKGKLVVVITEDIPINRDLICSCIGRSEEEIIFQKGEFNLTYLTELQEKISEKISNNELPFVISSSIIEKINRIEVLVTSLDNSVTENIKTLDTKGGAIVFTISAEKIDLQ